MPFDASGKWIPESDSVVEKLNGLMATDSPYLTQARVAGTRTANRRGLANSSLAAGASEAAAIAAAAPIASQEAQMLGQKNQAVLEGGIQYDNSSRLQTQQDAAALERQNVSEAGLTSRQLSQQQATQELTRLDSELSLLRQRDAQGFELTRQERDNMAAMERQRESIASSDRQALLGAEVSIRNTDVNASNDMRNMYLNAVSNLTNNPKLKAADRNAYIAEFQRITGMSASFGSFLGGASLNWGGTTTTTPATGTPA